VIASRHLFPLAALLVCGVASAQGLSADQVLAQSLFDQGVELMDKQDYAAACPKLAESQRLDPAGGTLLNLGLCREKEGKIASAWIAYNDAYSQAIKDGRKDREDTARARIDALGDKISKITVDVPAEVAAVPGLQVKLDGTELRQPAWGSPSPIDKGDHELAATATGKIAWSQTVHVDADGVTLRVAVPPLTDAPKPPPTEAEPVKTSPQKTVAFVTGGVGVALLVLGTTTGILAIDRRKQSDSECPSNQCTQRGVDLNDQAKTLAWISDFGIGLGAAALVTGIILLATAPRSPSKTAWILPARGGAQARWEF
jgi:hypothetical protein